MRLRILLVLALLGAAPISTVAHDIATQANLKLKWNVKRSNYMPLDRNLPTTSRNPDEYVMVLANLWALDQEIKVCFYGGDEKLRRRILTAGAEWFKFTNLRFDASAVRDCAPGDRSEIRIGFTEPGYWSYIGTDSLNPNLVKKNLASMNFGGWDFRQIEDPRFTGVVLHEFGHALGFHHEHQSPGTDCSTEYDWDKLYVWYWNQFKWSKEKVDQNLRPLLRDVSAYEWSSRDAASIMVYASNTKFLLNGAASKCNFSENYVLSELDKQGVQRAYATQGSGQQDRINKLRRAVAMTSNTEERDRLIQQLQAVQKKNATN